MVLIACAISCLIVGCLSLVSLLLDIAIDLFGCLARVDLCLFWVALWVCIWMVIAMYLCLYLWFNRYWWIDFGGGFGLLLFNSVGLGLIGLLVVLLWLLCVGLIYG